MLEKTLEDPSRVKPVNPKRNQPYIMFIGRTDAEVPIFWPPDVKSRLTEKDPNARRGGRQKEKGVTKDEMVRQHHRLNWYESEQTPRDCEGQGSLAFWGAKSHIQLSG